MKTRKRPWGVIFSCLSLLSACSGAVGSGSPVPGSGGVSAVGGGSGGTGGRVGAGGASASGSGGRSADAGVAPDGGADGTGGRIIVMGPGGSSGSAGSADASVAVDGASLDPPAGYVAAIIGVGYGGLRIVSRDGGRTWGDRAYAKTNGGDDEDLLRAVVYGKGMWIAMGWKLFTSTDGMTWVDHGLLGDAAIPACSIVEGLAYKDGYFYAACTPWNSPGAVFRSSDGLSWTKLSNIGATQGHLFLTYRGGKFVAYGDSLTSYQSTDAVIWTVLPAVQEATYCLDTFASQSACLDSSWFENVWLRADWQGKISRSTDGRTFVQVYLDDQKNTLYQSRALAAGFVAPR